MALKHLITCVVAGIDYLVHPQILGSVEESVRADQILPVLVLSERELESGPEKLWDILQYYVNNDDVCIDDFTGILVVTPTPEADSDSVPTNVSSPDLSRFSSVYRMSSESITSVKAHEISSGPYFLSGPNLHQAWRLYPDDLEAFNFGLIPENVLTSEKDSHAFRSILGTVPVPSRHYHQPTPVRPFAGLRMALTDAFDIEGVRTTLSSRAWTNMYPVATANGPYVMHLLDQGAIIVGKTKTPQFSAGTEWVDFQSPVNPRADQYQQSSGSSSGAAASLAGYSWLDYAVGEDSDGGVRESAIQHGLYGLRPTYGSASPGGIETASPRHSTVGLLGRSLSDLAFLTKHTLDVSQPAVGKSLTSKIIYPTDFFPLASPEHQKLLESFVEKLEAHIGVKKVEVNLTQLWAEGSDFSSAANKPLQEYMRKAPFWSLCYDFHQAFGKFRREYIHGFDREPFFEAFPRLKWNIGANITDAERDLYLERISEFRTWFDREVMSSNEHGAQDAILILPHGNTQPLFRDAPQEYVYMDSSHDLMVAFARLTYSSGPAVVEGLNAVLELLSPLLGTPHLVVPFAQLPFESRVSGRTEYKPIAMSIMGTRGNDLALIRLVEETLQSAGWRSKVDTGRQAFPLGSNSRNIDDVESVGGQYPKAVKFTNGAGFADWSEYEL